MVQEFLGRLEAHPTHASFAVAGPVVNDRARPTNLAWPLLDGEELRRDLGLEKVWLLKDLQALANAVPGLDSRELETLHAGKGNVRAAEPTEAGLPIGRWPSR